MKNPKRGPWPPLKQVVKMKTETATKKITQSGDSLVINVTKEVKRLGLGRGDDVNVTLARALSEDLDFISQAIDNAIGGLGCPVSDTGLISASPSAVDAIYRAVSLIAPSGLVVGCNPVDYVPLVTIEVFTEFNERLKTWRFDTTPATDHD